ncbi:hypothetical protein ACSBR1_020735 [Camellia fascicularis]
MASSNHSKLSLAITLLIVATAASVAHGIFIIGGRDVVELIVAGQLVCTVPGTNCPTCPGIGGVNVFLSCNGGQTSLAQAITDPAGLVNFTVSFLDGTLFDQSRCFVYARLPIASCVAFPPTGNLHAVVKLVGFVQQTIGLVANSALGPFTVA